MMMARIHMDSYGGRVVGLRRGIMMIPRCPSHDDVLPGADLGVRAQAALLLPDAERPVERRLHGGPASGEEPGVGVGGSG